MTRHSSAHVISLAVSLLSASAVAPRPLHAATPSEVRSLRGLSGVEVVIENLTDEMQGLGLNAEQLRGEVQSRLQESGIRVLTADDQASGRPWLYVRISAFKSSNVPLVSYYVSAQLRQDVTLDRSPDLHLGAITWDVGAGGLAGVSVIVEAVRGTVQNLAEKFSTEFLTVNNRR